MDRVRQEKKNGRCRGVTVGGHCREVAVSGRCLEVVVSGGSTVFRNSSECLIQINTTLHNLNLTSTNRENQMSFRLCSQRLSQQNGL